MCYNSITLNLRCPFWQVEHTENRVVDDLDMSNSNVNQIILVKSVVGVLCPDCDCVIP